MIEHTKPKRGAGGGENTKTSIYKNVKGRLMLSSKQGVCVYILEDEKRSETVRLMMRVFVLSWPESTARKKRTAAPLPDVRRDEEKHQNEFFLVFVGRRRSEHTLRRFLVMCFLLGTARGVGS